MRATLYFIICLGLTFSLSNCGETFSTVVEIDPPEFVSQLTASSFITEGDSLVNFFVGQNESIFNTGGIDDYGLSEVTLSIKNEQTGEALQLGENSSISSYSYNYQSENIDDTFFSPLQEYTFEIMHADFETSTTKIKMPPSSDVLENITYRRNDGIDIEGNQTSSISFDILDDAGVENHYELELVVPNEFNSFPLFIETIDPTGVRGYPDSNLYFSDETFNGQTKNIKVSFYRDEYDPARNDFIELRFRSLDKASYDYIRSLRRHKDTEGQPFLSPVQVLSNINNALGNITLKTEYRYKVE